jgi:tetratricopeptide (TPR) repeat protein
MPTPVFISSTARDLPEHRKEVLDACLRQGMIPKMMEDLYASEADVVATSLRLVDEADLYLGVFAYRYGYVPAGYDISVTEMEYNRAVERGIPRLIFIMHEDHPIRAADVETGASAEELRKLKERLKKENIVNFFKSPEDLRAQAISALSLYRERDQTAYHYVSDIPEPPEPYIVHPYTLLPHGLIGRREELNFLTEWVARPDSEVYRAHVLGIVAIGGIGKSALMWKWFNDIAPREMSPLSGRVWWSFYESDTSYENFVISTLAYVNRRPREEIQQLHFSEREHQLLTILDSEPFLLVLDGLERILMAYARMDAARIIDDNLDERVNNIAGGLPKNAAQSLARQHQLRKSADPRAGSFLRKLVRIRASRILVGTRLYPRELQDPFTDEPIPGSYAYFLKGLNDDDAVELWRAHEVSGSRETLLPLFHTFDNHPLLIQALAGEVKRYRRAPGDFDLWRQQTPGFDPFSLPLSQARSHVLEYALQGLDANAREILNVIAAFRMPATYDTLAALLVGEGKLLSRETQLDSVMSELEDRGLVGWDKRANRYDLHPIVRGIIWSGLDSKSRQSIYSRLRKYFESIPAVSIDHVDKIEDLVPTIELYNTLVGLERYDDAAGLFINYLDSATQHRLSASRLRVELLELLFPDGLDHLPRQSHADTQAFILGALAKTYSEVGQPGRAIPLLRRQLVIEKERGFDKNLTSSYLNLAEVMRETGQLRESEIAALRALEAARRLNDRLQEAIALHHIGQTLALIGLKECREWLSQAIQIFAELGQIQPQGVTTITLAEHSLLVGDVKAARSFAERAWKLAQAQRFERDLIVVRRLLGVVALSSGEFQTASELFYDALARARAVNFVEGELQTLVGLAELRLRQGDYMTARDLLEDLWEPAERAPYPLIQADAMNLLTEIEREKGNRSAAVEAATGAYRRAWCDGPPYAYHWGLEKAREHLNTLNEQEPLLPAFDASRYEPLPEIDLNGLDKRIKESKPSDGQKEIITIKNVVSAHRSDALTTFFKAAGYIIVTNNQNDFQVTPTRPFDKETYGSSLVRYLETLPTIEGIQEFCNKALLVPDSPTSGYKPAFLVCPRLEPIHQLQAAVYQDKRLAVVPITYDWILEANARGEQRKSLQSVLDAFVGREDPFRYSNPVSVPGDFYGRIKVAATLVRDLDRGQSVGLFGMRKIGKTSLVQHTIRTRTGPTIYIDCQGLTHPATILQRLPHELRLSLQKLLPRVKWPEFDEDTIGDIENLTNAVGRYLRDLFGLYSTQSTSISKITLILDEVDRIVPDSTRPASGVEEYEALFGLIRGLGQGVERILVCMVAGFSADITQKDVGLSRGVAGNPVYAFFNVRRLEPMDAEEVALMMNGLGSRARLLFTKGGGYRLYQWSGGHPFLARLMGSIIHRNTDGYKLKRANIEGSEAYEVDEVAVDRAADELLEDVTSRPYVEQILERFSEPLHKAIFMKLAQAGSEGCTRETLMALSQSSKSEPNVADALNSLEVASLVRKKDRRYKLFARLLDELIRRGYV